MINTGEQGQRRRKGREKTDLSHIFLPMHVCLFNPYEFPSSSLNTVDCNGTDFIHHLQINVVNDSSGYENICKM
jgi:hypothetical protein